MHCRTTIVTRKMATHLAFLSVICLHLATSVGVFGQALTTQDVLTVDNRLTITRDGMEFVATIVSICQDPIEGYLLKCQAGTSTVLIWEDDVRNLTIGLRYRILGTYIGPMKYPSGDVNVYVAIVWEVIG